MRGETSSVLTHKLLALGWIYAGAEPPASKLTSYAKSRLTASQPSKWKKQSAADRPRLRSGLEATSKRQGRAALRLRGSAIWSDARYKIPAVPKVDVFEILQNCLRTTYGFEY